MKRTERHRLKGNPVSDALARARLTLAGHERAIMSAVVVLVLVAAAAAVFMAWRERVQDQAAGQLARALTILEAPLVPAGAGDTAGAPLPGTIPSEQARLEAALPRLLDVAAQHPTARAGIAARYHAASVLADLGRYDEAAQRYREVTEQAGARIYGEMARLGLAAIEARRGNYDAAIAAYEEAARRPDHALPVDALLMQLGRTYLRAGREAEALDTFTRIVDEFPQSLYLAEASQQIDDLTPAGGA